MTKLDFRVSAGLKNIIGQELITNDNVAVFELVKNSYDAYAKSVRIVFQHVGDKNLSQLLIIDDGEGMTSLDIKNKWLFVGYSDKKGLMEKIANEDKRPNKPKRFFAGVKGIGRFSCDRLGTMLNLYTKKKGENTIHLLKVNWKEFEMDQKEEFQNIDVDYSEVKKVVINGYELNSFTHGTILEISPLNTSWDGEKLRDLKKYLQRLINPSNPKADEFKIYLEASEYKDEDKEYEDDYKINGLVKNFVFERLGIKTTHIRCIVANDTITTELIDKGNLIFKISEKNNKYPHLRDIKILVFYLNQSAKTTFTRLMGFAPIDYGSIFLYKNNFRIQPYGDVGDDWLGLEKRKGQGYSRNLATRELIGRIELEGAQPDFREVSSREGVQKTVVYEELQELFRLKVLRPLERYVVEAIDWGRESGIVKSSSEIKADSIKIISSLVGKLEETDTVDVIGPDLLEIVKEKQIGDLPNLIKNFEVIEKHIKDKKARKHVSVQLDRLKTASKRLAKERRELKEELSVKEKEGLFLKKAVSSDQETVINLNHTIENSSLAIEGIIEDLNGMIKKDTSLSVVAPYIDKISMEIKKITTLAGIVSMANFNLKVASIKKNIVQYMTEYIGLVLGGKGGDMRVQVIGGDTYYSISFKPLEISIMLDNFISNSKKAHANLMIVSFNKARDGLHVHIADNGRGVQNNTSKNLFNRGYTTTNGAGIGLYYIKSIIENMGGDIQFLGNNYDEVVKGACFELVLK